MKKLRYLTLLVVVVNLLAISACKKSEAPKIGDVYPGSIRCNPTKVYVRNTDGNFLGYLAEYNDKIQLTKLTPFGASGDTLTDSAMVFVYNDASQVSEVKRTGHNTVNYIYQDGRLTSYSNNTSGSDKIFVNYTYDGNGQVSTKRDESSQGTRITTYSGVNNGRPTTAVVKDLSNKVLEAWKFEYSDAGNVASISKGVIANNDVSEYQLYAKYSYDKDKQNPFFQLPSPTVGTPDLSYPASPFRSMNSNLVTSIEFYSKTDCNYVPGTNDNIIRKHTYRYYNKNKFDFYSTFVVDISDVCANNIVKSVTASITYSTQP